MSSPAAETTSDDDAVLLAEIASGDLDAPLVELYRRYGPQVYSFGLKRLHDPGLAEELVQETFLRLWRTAKRFQPARGRVGAYVFSIATTIAVDLRRRPSSRPHAPEPHPDTTAQDDPANDLITSITVHAALDALAPAHRETLTLAHTEGLTCAQIAAKLEIPVGTVKTRLYHGLRGFRRALQARGIEV